MEMLNLVDENDDIIGQETRKNIHKNGLLHRELHVWLFTNNGELIFQKRGPNKDTYPGFLDASVGCHVGLNEDYQTTALREMKEKTGIDALGGDLIYITKTRQKSHEEITNTTNNSWREVYAFRYNGDIKDLKVEKDEADGFELWPIAKILDPAKQEKEKFVPSVFDNQRQDIFRKIQTLV